MDNIVIVGDAHSNSTIGLCPRGVKLEEGGIYTPTDTQKWLWDNWLAFCEHTAQYKNISTFINGDWPDGDPKHRTHQVISRHPSTILNIAIDNLQPIVDISERVFFTRGTRSHTGISGWLETELSRDCDIAVEDGGDLWNKFYGEFSGVVFDIKHFGRLGMLPWTLVNSLHSLAVQIEIIYSRQRMRVPDIVVRNHRHITADTYDNHPVRVIANGAWQGITEYANDITDKPPDIGGVLVHCDGGKYEVEKKFYPFRKRKLWTMPTGKKTLINTLLKR